MYAIRQAHMSHNRSVKLNDDRSVYSVHSEIPILLVGTKTHADAIYTRPKSNQKRREGNDEQPEWYVHSASVYSVASPPIWITLLPWQIRNVLRKIINQVLGMFKVFCRFPAHAYVVVTGPLNHILQIPIAPPRV